jgi:hypothetical protein
MRVEIETTITVKLPKSTVEAIAGVVQKQTNQEALRYAIEEYFGSYDMESHEFLMFNREYESEEQATRGVNEFCTRVARDRYPEQDAGEQAKHAKKMASAVYRVRRAGGVWIVESAVQATFAE